MLGLDDGLPPLLPPPPEEALGLLDGSHSDNERNFILAIAVAQDRRAGEPGSTPRGALFDNFTS